MTYELINMLTTNTLAAFENEDDARREYAFVCEQDPAHQDAYVLVALDDEGEAQEVLAGPPAALEQLVA